MFVAQIITPGNLDDICTEMTPARLSPASSNSMPLHYQHHDRIKPISSSGSSGPSSIEIEPWRRHLCSGIRQISVRRIVDRATLAIDGKRTASCGKDAEICRTPPPNAHLDRRAKRTEFKLIRATSNVDARLHFDFLQLFRLFYSQ